MSNKISIIIPVYNEEIILAKTLQHILQHSNANNIADIIVVDGGSTDNTIKIASSFKQVTIITSEKGRAKQLNVGANIAKGQILYFLHCDSYPPKQFDEEILRHVNLQKEAGCFRMQFDDKHLLLKFFGWLTRFNNRHCRGGDQSLFVVKPIFEVIQGYNEKYIIYEDNEIIERLYKRKKFVVMPLVITTSARRYRQIGVWRLQYHFMVIHIKHKLGHSVESMVNYYNNII